MESSKSKFRHPLAVALTETFGLSPALASLIALLVTAVCILAVVWVVRSAPPSTVTISSGPPGSSFQRYADSYKEKLAQHGITLVVLPSEGSLDNLRRLQAADAKADFGFVQSGLAADVALGDLVSLGTIAYQPLWIFYRSPAPITRIAELAGKRIAIGPEGSGTHALALTLLKANGIAGAPTTFADLDATAASAALTAGKVDAVFLMGDSAPRETVRTLLRAPEVQLYNFIQADAYSRRYDYLNKLELPQGSIDLARNLPSQDIALVGLTVELVAQRELNSAVSDLLLDIAQQVHGRAGLLQKRGEFPAPIERGFPLSPDAVRFYKSGKSFLYRAIDSFWLASLLNRVLVAVVPLALLLIPAIRLLPLVYRWSNQLRIYKCYRPLLILEREVSGPLTRERSLELLERLDEIERMVDQLRMPASFADQFYGLRHHITFVRQRLRAAASA